MPVGENAPTDGIVVPVHAANPDSAGRFLEFLLSAEVQPRIATLPTNNALLNNMSDPIHVKGADMIQRADMVLQAFDIITPKAMADKAMAILRRFMLKEVPVKEATALLEVARQEVFFGKVAVPVISPPGNSFSGSVNITMTTLTEGATIHFTQDGSPVTATSPIFTQSIVISEAGTHTIRAMATKRLMTDSETVLQVFVVVGHSRHMWPIIVGLGALLAVGVVVVCGVVLYRKKREVSRILKAAPTGDVTIVFTDVEKSTELWQRFGFVMGDALKTHNQVIRECIVAHAGYEVKTVGDSFMVAFGSPRDAVEFAVAVQRRLLQAEWPPDLANHPSGAWEEKDGVTVFKGFRVRMGLHQVQNVHCAFHHRPLLGASLAALSFLLKDQDPALRPPPPLPRLHAMCAPSPSANREPPSMGSHSSDRNNGGFPALPDPPWPSLNTGPHRHCLSISIVSTFHGCFGRGLGWLHVAGVVVQTWGGGGLFCV